VNRIESLNDISVNQCHREAVDVGAGAGHRIPWHIKQKFDLGTDPSSNPDHSRSGTDRWTRSKTKQKQPRRNTKISQ